MASRFIEENTLNDFLFLAYKNGWTGKKDREFLEAMYLRAKNEGTDAFDVTMNTVRDFDLWYKDARPSYMETTAGYLEGFEDIYELFSNTEMQTVAKSQEELNAEKKKAQSITYDDFLKMVREEKAGVKKEEDNPNIINTNSNENNNIINNDINHINDINIINDNAAYPQILFKHTESIETLVEKMGETSENLKKSSQPEKQKTARGLDQFKDAFQTLLDASNGVEEDQNKIKKAYDKAKEFPEFLMTGKKDYNNYTLMRSAFFQKEYLQFAAEDLRPVFKEKYANSLFSVANFKIVQKNADQWIDQFKLDFVKEAGSEHPNLEREQYIVAKIMAARMLVNSERNKKSTLEKPLTNQQIDQKAKELLENKDFKEWVGSLSQNTLKDNIDKKYTHGGLLDDMLKKYLLNKPAGQLNNDPLLARYMPKVIDRIEVLQTQARSVPAGKCPTKEIAEVMLLRTMIKAPRNHKESLKVPIPTNTRLPEDVKSLAEGNDYTFRQVINTPKVISDFQEGHGGLMIVNLKNAADDNLMGGLGIRKVEDKFLITNRMADLQEQAKKLKEDLEKELKKDPDSGKIDKLCEKVDTVIAQQLVLTGIMMNNIAKKENSFSPSDNPCPSMTEVEKMTEKTLKGDLMKQLLPEGNVQMHLDEISKFAKDPRPFAYGKKILTAPKPEVSNNIEIKENLKTDDNNIINTDPKAKVKLPGMN